MIDTVRPKQPEQPSAQTLASNSKERKRVERNIKQQWLITFQCIADCQSQHYHWKLVKGKDFLVSKRSVNPPRTDNSQNTDMYPRKPWYFRDDSYSSTISQTGWNLVYCLLILNSHLIHWNKNSHQKPKQNPPTHTNKTTTTFTGE